MQVEIDRVFQATREQLYAIWTDANQISQWFGCPIVIDPKVGGQLRFEFPGEPAATTGQFKELIPFSKVSFTWNSFHDGASTGETLVTVTFEEIDSRQTRMKLVHSGFRTESAAKEHNEGWNYYFDKWTQKFAS
jgi:uncharacterized protein YndB with AHSA1/START domain